MRVLPFVFILSLTLSSCYYNKSLVYLQDKSFSETRTALVENKRSPYRLQPFDILAVQIKSPVELRELYGGVSATSNPNSMFATPGNLYLEGYSVDANGKIHLPVIGEVVVKGLSLEEAQAQIQIQANKFLNKATVSVKLTSFKITVLGEVKNPGYYYVYNNQATVLEALGMAGDLTNFGNRKKVKLIRQVSAGSEVILLNLTESDLLNSEYFFLMPGDVLYVEPLRARSKRSNLDLLTVLFSTLTTAVLVLSYVNSSK
jgi:polysaccharide export outer membrane protein